MVSSRDISITMSGFESLVKDAQTKTSDGALRHASFNALIYHFHNMAYGYAHAYLSDPLLAEEAVQEAFIVAYYALESLRIPHAFPTWLRRIVYSECHRILRRRTPLSQPLDAVVDVAAAQPSPQQILETRELQNAVHAAIQALPLAQRIPILLYYIDDYSQEEIAQFLDLSVAAVKKRLERARRSLETRMKPMVQEYLHSERPSSSEQLTQNIHIAIMMQAAALEGQHLLLEQLLIEGADVNALDRDGQTLLHWAVKEGDLEAVEMLLNFQADRTIQDRAGKSALQYAEEHHQRQIVNLLRRSPIAG
jgi:RNA polymerase sigma-70 factor (ECF subfamily)